MSHQIPTYSVSTELIMRSAAFARGVADRRAGLSPAYDSNNFCFDQSDGDEVATVKTNDLWRYERGRQWACLAPLSMPLEVNGRLNPKAVALYKAARQREFIQ